MCISFISLYVGCCIGFYILSPSPPISPKAQTHYYSVRGAVADTFCGLSFRVPKSMRLQPFSLDRNGRVRRRKNWIIMGPLGLHLGGGGEQHQRQQEAAGSRRGGWAAPAAAESSSPQQEAAAPSRQQEGQQGTDGAWGGSGGLGKMKPQRGHYNPIRSLLTRHF